MPTRYAFPSKFSFYNDLDAQALGDELDALIDARKEHVTPEEIIAAARKRDSTLRQAFTWDDADAAHRWRRSEAKRLVNRLMVAKQGKPTRTRAFVFVHHAEHGKKVLMSRRSAMTRPEMREELVELAVRHLRRSLTMWGSTYGAMPELRRIAKNAKALKQHVERQLMAGV